ncbi:signal peptidase complex subunit 2, putative [Babesia caballi]|uniref:Signal peptidase complex subunit 2 n=1 Tax=Babesia caballi TaxID=5871 RepID=A0AAV4LR78_BABCB|nr:signal peptidase complex subunit 2, putative [Babesia caballi]
MKGKAQLNAHNGEDDARKSARRIMTARSEIVKHVLHAGDRKDSPNEYDQREQRVCVTISEQELCKLGLKEDASASYIRILCYLLLSAIGTYSAVFTGVEKNRPHLQLSVILFFSILAVSLLYDKVVLRGITYRLYVADKFVVNLWCNVNWQDGTYEIKYARAGDSGHEATYTVKLGDAFFEDGKLDEEWYRESMAKLCKEITALESKKTA